MHPVDLRELHGRLWRLVQSEGIEIRTNARCTQPDPLEEGFFHPDLYGCGPTIQLWRNSVDTVDDHAQELVTLAHEYGHALSHRRGQRPRVAMPAPAADLRAHEKDMVEAEEARAWAHGREVLKDLDSAYEFALFDRRKRE